MRGKAPPKNYGELCLTSGWRKFDIFLHRPGVAKKIKAAMNRRARRKNRQEINSETDAEEDNTDGEDFWVGIMYELIDAVGGKRGKSIPEDVEHAKNEIIRLRKIAECVKTERKLVQEND